MEQKDIKEASWKIGLGKLSRLFNQRPQDSLKNDVFKFFIFIGLKYYAKIYENCEKNR
jgi:hypothetical protein